MVLATFTLATTTATEMRLHREECNRRDEKNASMFQDITVINTEINKSLAKLTEDSNTKHVENIEKMNAIAKTATLETSRVSSKVAWIMGAIAMGSFVLNAVVVFGSTYIHHP